MACWRLLRGCNKRNSPTGNLFIPELPTCRDYQASFYRHSEELMTILAKSEGCDTPKPPLRHCPGCNQAQYARSEQGPSFNICLGISGVLPCKNGIYNQRVGYSVFCDLLFFLVTVIGQMVLGSISCAEKIHCTAVFALRNGKFSMLGRSDAPTHTSSYALSLVESSHWRYRYNK